MLGEVIGTGSRATVHACGPGLVAKVPLPSTPDRWIRDEALHTSAVRGAGVAVPEMVELAEIDGRTVAVYERIDGPSMWACIVAEPDRAADFGRQLAELHLAVLAAAPSPALPSQHDRLCGKIRRAARTVSADVGAALGMLPGAPPTLALCHGDLHPGNVLMSASGPVIIDWFDAGRGEPAADVARSSLLMGGGGRTSGSVLHLPGATDSLLAPLHRAYLAAVLGSLHLTGSDLRIWLRVQAAARLAEDVSRDDLLAVWAGEPGT